MIEDSTSVIAAPYLAVESANDAQRPFSVIHQSGHAHGRWQLVGRYMSRETADDVAKALNTQRIRSLNILGDL